MAIEEELGKLQQFVSSLTSGACGCLSTVLLTRFHGWPSIPIRIRALYDN